MATARRSVNTRRLGPLLRSASGSSNPPRINVRTGARHRATARAGASPWMPPLLLLHHRAVLLLHHRAVLLLHHHLVVAAHLGAARCHECERHEHYDQPRHCGPPEYGCQPLRSRRMVASASPPGVTGKSTFCVRTMTVAGALLPESCRRPGSA